ncbi:MAG: MotA/TolQ/ExbB proton channel family protein [Sphaerotilus natans]
MNPSSPLQTAIKFFQDCGPFLYPSLLLMALGLAIGIERLLFLQRAQRDNRRLWSRLKMLLESGQWREASALAMQSDAAMGRIVRAGIERMGAARNREELDAALEEDMLEIVPRLEQRTHYLATFANVITLVGLLGTIIGLIKAFTAVAQVNAAEKSELLSAGISIAMNNTAFALMVAIPFLLLHAYLQARTTEVVDALEAARLSFLNLAQRRAALGA